MRDLAEDEEVIRVPRIALMECYNILLLLGPWCAGRVAETLAKQVINWRIVGFFIYLYVFYLFRNQVVLA